MEEAATSGETTTEARSTVKDHAWFPILAGAALALLLLLIWSTAVPEKFTSLFDSLESTDIEQGRIDTALPAPQGDLAFTQTFIPRHNGLDEIEVTLLRYNDPVSGESAQLSLQLFDERDELVAEEILPTASISHNQVVRLSFAPQGGSEGRQYTLRMAGTPDNQVSVWGYSIDTYGDGQLEQAGAQAQDLRFLTRYRLTWGDALGSVGETVFYEGILLLLALLVLPLPGVLLLLVEHAYRVRQKRSIGDGRSLAWDPAAWWGAALALGVAGWPILWVLVTLVWAHLTGWLLALFVIGGWIAAAFYWWTERTRRLKEATAPGIEIASPPIAAPWRWDHLLLLAIIVVGLAVRLVAVRDTPVLPWVDASRHALITAIMAQTGQTISDYAPYLPVDRFPYHFGFHTLSSTLLMLSGWPLERLLLYLGQLLNGLVPLTIFASVWLLIKSRNAGYLAAFLVALPFFFPAYYTTWGRMTQITAVLLLPVLLAFTWQLVRGSDAWIDRWWLVGILVAGLFLIHFRVLVYYLPFPLLVLLVSRLRRTRWLIAAAVLAFLLSAPHIFALLGDTDPVARLGSTIPDYNKFPMNYITTGWERAFLALAAVALLLTLIAALRRQKWVVLPLVLAGWVATLFALLSLDRLGLPVPSLVNLNSMYIILFVPLAIFLAVVIDQVWRWLSKRSRPVRLVGYVLTGALLAALMVFGVRRQVNILNLQTLLVKSEDMVGLRWLEENVPEDALVAVNSWRWLGETWAAADGGAWILPLSGRSVTTPPIDHIYNAELFTQVREFNQEASTVSDWSDPAQAQWLRERGVSHVFVGKRGGFFDPAKLAANPRMELIFDRSGVYIFAVGE
ncbi:MAG: hypothetical protein ACK2UN_04620 [Candidatus Promineifilaceae bacterium]|jgi:hypothetical protein